MSNLWQAAQSGIRWTLGARVALQLVSWPITLLSMRLLEPRDYGLLALSIIVLGVVTLVSDLGFGVTLVQAKQADDTTIRSASGLVILFGLLLAGALAWSAPLIAGWFSAPELAPVLRVMSLDVIASALALVPQINLERQLRFKELSISLLASGVCGVAFTLVGALLGWGVWALVAGALTGTFVRSGLQIFYHRGVVLPRLSLQALRLHIRAGSHVMGSRALWYWYSQSDQIILGRLTHASALGSYNVASQIAMLPVAKAMDTINRVAFPTLSRLNDGNPTGIASIHLRLLRLTALYSIGVCWGLSAVADGLIPLLLGDRWQAAAGVLTFLALIAPLRMLAAVQNTAATAAGSPQAVTKELLLASLTVPFAVWAGALTGDIVNAAIAWVCTYPLVYLASTWFTARAIGVPYLSCIRSVAAPALVGALMMAGVALVKRALEGVADPATVLAVSMVVGALTYILGMQLLAPVLMQDARRSLVEIARARTATG